MQNSNENENENENENFTEQANKLIDKIILHYGDKDCEFDDTEMTKIVFNKREVWYNYHSLVYETMKRHVFELEEIALEQDDKGDLEYLNDVLIDIMTLRVDYQLYELEGELHNSFYSIEKQLWRYKMKLVWSILPLDVKQKWMKFAIQDDYDNRISKSTKEKFLTYLTDKYM